MAESSLRHLFKDISIYGKNIETEISQNTEKYRKGNFTLEFRGNTKVKSIKVNQTKHSFYFGCNTFMLDSFDSKEKNTEYKEKFKKLFNLGVVGTFWKDYEPQKGVYRFERDAPFIYRRPPVDSALQFCKGNSIIPKAHNLVWHQAGMKPKWLNENKNLIMQDIYDYMIALSKRFGDEFSIIDVANEHLCRASLGRWGEENAMPRDYVFNAFQKANELFPNSKLMTNENHMHCWVNFCYDSSSYYMYLKALLASGCRVDAIGMQYHAFLSKKHEEYFGTAMMNIESLNTMLKEYESFDKPMQISEITIPSTLFGEPVDEGFQREISENLFRLWFSRPNMEGIIWWNLLDGTAYENEDEYKGALLRSDMSEKPVYQMLDRLINKEWHTEYSTSDIRNNKVSFRGFYGKYDIDVDTDGKSYHFDWEFNFDGVKAFVLD